MDKNIEEIISTLLNDFYKHSDGGGRKNELKIELRYSLRKIANRIDRGFNLEVRVAPQKEDAEAGTAEERYYEEMIMKAAPTLQFFKREGSPVLTLEEAKEEPTEKKVPKNK